VPIFDLTRLAGPLPARDPRIEQGWANEADRLIGAMCDSDHDAARCADLPDELAHHADHFRVHNRTVRARWEAAIDAADAAADADGDADYPVESDVAYFTIDDWMESLWDCDYGLTLVFEQAADERGVLLPLDQRALRLYTAPQEWVAEFNAVTARVPEHVFVHIVLWTTWAVRIARARATGSPHWKPAPEDPPPPEPAFRASKYKPRRYGL